MQISGVKVLGLTGWSGSGKTTLLAALIPRFIARGLSVSTIKHAHHGFDLDQPGKDSWRHRQAGAREVLVASSVRWALLHEVAGEEPGLPELLERLSPVDLVIVEGYKANPHPKIEVHRPALGKPPLWPDRPDIVAVACDDACDIEPPQQLPLNDPAAIVDWALGYLQIHAAVHTVS
jgi:molybdopterin-guanine dinucleotide biosynthesis protein B